MVMKWQKHLLMKLLLVSVLVACSDSNSDEPTSSAQEANTPAPATETLQSDAKEKRSDAANQRLKARVQMMTELAYPGENTKKFTLKNVFKYDKNGNRLELLNYRPDGGLNSTVRSAYDSAGKVVSEETILGDGSIDTKTVIKTDENGNRVEQNDLKQTTKGNKLFNRRYLYRYDAQAHMTEWLAYQGNGNFSFKYTFNYDANGNRTEWLQLTQTNQLIGKVEYKYDDKNNIIEETKYKGDGTLTEKATFTYEFDKKGNWIRQKKVVNGAVVEVRERQYKYF